MTVTKDPNRESTEFVTNTMVTTLLLTDLVDSTKLVDTLGDKRTADIFARHDRLARDLLTAHGGREIDKTDGFLFLFGRPIDAVLYALSYHESLRHLSEELGVPLTARAGIHLGELVFHENSPEDVERGAKPIEVEGIAKPLAARIMSLAQGGQTLMTQTAFDLARRAVIDSASAPANVAWIAHGAYLLKGYDEPVETFEVGVEGVAPLQAPPDSDKARRSVAAGDEETLGWRPASGLPVPQRKGWILERKIGEGGFGEVWLAANKRTTSRRVFKFCFDSDRLRSLKRELTLFRLLRDALGDRKDIARLYEVQLEEAPFFLESEFTELGSMVEWSEAIGGIDTVPLDTRIDLVARIARATAAAHSVGILHKDIKPGNILIFEDEDGQPRPRLADFGIGTLTDQGELQGRNITMAGFTEDITEGESAATGTRMYAPPEILSGKPFTALGDVYALGVLLYQMVVGDFGRPLAQGWERDVRDPVLREDIAVCVDGNEQQRMGSPQGLAKRLETIAERRRADRRRKAGRITALAGGVMIVLLGLATAWGVQRGALLKTAVSERDKAKAMNVFLEGILQSADPRDSTGREVLVVDVLDKSAEALQTQFADQPDVKASMHVTLGRTYKQLDNYQKAETQLAIALNLRREFLEAPHVDLAEALHELAAAMYWLDAFDEAKALYLEALEQRLELAERTGDDDIKRAVADTLNHLGATCHQLNQPDEAAEFFRRSLAIRREFLPDGTRDVARTLNNFANWLLSQGRYAEAEEHFRELVPMFRDIYEGPHADLATGLGNFGRCLLYLEHYDEARELMEESVDMKREVLGSDNPRLASGLRELGNLHMMLDDPGTAEPLLREAADIQRRSLPQRDRRTADTEARLAGCLLRLDRLDEAEDLLLRAFPILKSGFGDHDARTQQAVQWLVDLYVLRGEDEKANGFRALLVNPSTAGE